MSTDSIGAALVMLLDQRKKSPGNTPNTIPRLWKKLCADSIAPDHRVYDALHINTFGLTCRRKPQSWSLIAHFRYRGCRSFIRSSSDK
jgi:hypothetical protein